MVRKFAPLLTSCLVIYMLSACSIASTPRKPDVLPTGTLTATNTPVTPTFKDDVPMVFVPAGKFSMGSNILPDEQPVHEVMLQAFWIDKYEIPNQAYQSCVIAGGCPQPVSWNHIDDPANKMYPMTLITWAEASQYCQWAGERLPSEAEWEKAARGTDGRVYPWGNQFKQSLARTAYDFDLTTVPVDRYPGGASPYGALNMAGNVWEWTADWYADDYYQVSPGDNPQGAASGDKKVARGGGYGGTEAVMRSAKRRDIYPDERGSYLGFRCAL